MVDSLKQVVTYFWHMFVARTLLLLGIYSIILIASLYIAYELRFDFEVPAYWSALRVGNIVTIVPLQLLLLAAFGHFRGLMSYFRLPDLYGLFGALGFASLLLVISSYTATGPTSPPRGVILADFVFSFVFMAGFRVILRILRERYFSDDSSALKATRRIAIIGAGDVGSSLASDLLMRRGLRMNPVVFLDDDKYKRNMHIHGVRVSDSIDNLAAMAKHYALDGIIIAMPSAPSRRIREVIEKAKSIGLTAEIVPSLAQLTTGVVKSTRIRPVRIEDLLGRDQVSLESENIQELIEGKIIMVTGAGGSIGSELCRQVANDNPKRLLMVDQSEVQLFYVEQQLIEAGQGSVVLPLIADILDEKRMRFIMENYRPEIIFHAAAHKQVPMMESQPAEAIKNNTLGTSILAELADEYLVKRFIYISTDKAINPTSVMGASKRLAEIYLQACQVDSGTNTQFMAVRFGNVLGSSGSVIPIFRRQIRQGGPVTVTHPQVARYFMTLSEAVGLILQCAVQGSGGEIFVLDMGQPIKILDLARQMIELSGLRPDKDIEIKFIGLRPGEKLFEELQHVGETLVETRHPRIFSFIGPNKSLQDVRPFFEELKNGVNSIERNNLKKMLKRHVPEYTPFLD